MSEKMTDNMREFLTKLADSMKEHKIEIEGIYSFDNASVCFNEKIDKTTTDSREFWTDLITHELIASKLERQ